MRHALVGSFAALLLVAAVTITAAPATPDQVGTYAGTAKRTYYDLGNGQKITETVPCMVTISEVNNTITFMVDNYTGTSPGCPLSPTTGGYYEGVTGGPAFTSVFSFKGKGPKISLKGTLQYVNPYVIMTGSFKLKKIPQAL